jgi:hypothetical protein
MPFSLTQARRGPETPTNERTLASPRSFRTPNVALVALVSVIAALAGPAVCRGTAGSPGSGHHRRTLATGTLSLQSGKSTTVKFALGPAAAAARRTHSVRLQVRVALLSGAMVTVTG